jgi:type IV pilus assembly protein PilX
MSRMNRIDQCRLPCRQRGMSMFITLIFLVLLTLIAVTAMRVTGLEERMAGNTRDRALAFQAAEMALRTAEGILTAATPPAFDSTSCFYPTQAAGTVLRETVDWAGASSCQVAYHSDPADDTSPLVSILSGVNTSPRFIIEELPPLPTSTSGGSVKESPTLFSEVGIYRVTARGVGGTGNAVVMIEGTYRR